MDFLTTKLDQRFADRFERRGGMGVSVRNILSCAFQAGGYVAGGFATLVARSLLKNEDNDSLVLSARNHLGSPQWVEGTNNRNFGCGDIDVWFPDESSLKDFMQDPRVVHNTAAAQGGRHQTISGAATEIVIPGSRGGGGARIQVITKYLRPIEEQLSAFDIYNGAVAFTETSMVVPEHWDYLENNDMIHVSTWASPWTMNRLLKWCSRKRYYTQVSPATADHVIKRVFKDLEWADKWLDVVERAPWAPVREGSVPDQREKIVDAIKQDRLRTAVILGQSNRLQALLDKVIPGLTNDQLLQVSALFSEPPDYDLAMQELRKRAWHD